MIPWYQYAWMWIIFPKSARKIYRNNRAIKRMQEDQEAIEAFTRELHDLAILERALIDEAKRRDHQIHNQAD